MFDPYILKFKLSKKNNFRMILITPVLNMNR